MDEAEFLDFKATYERKVAEADAYLANDPKAIEEALLSATSGDVVLVAGKGHEETQVFSHVTIPFSDRSVIEEFYARRTTGGAE